MDYGGRRSRITYGVGCGTILNAQYALCGSKYGVPTYSAVRVQWHSAVRTGVTRRCPRVCPRCGCPLSPVFLTRRAPALDNTSDNEDDTIGIAAPQYNDDPAKAYLASSLLCWPSSFVPRTPQNQLVDWLPTLPRSTRLIDRSSNSAAINPQPATNMLSVDKPHIHRYRHRDSFLTKGTFRNPCVVAVADYDAAAGIKALDSATAPTRLRSRFPFVSTTLNRCCMAQCARGAAFPHAA